MNLCWNNKSNHMVNILMLNILKQGNAFQLFKLKDFRNSMQVLYFLQFSQWGFEEFYFLQDKISYTWNWMLMLFSNILLKCIFCQTKELMKGIWEWWTKKRGLNQYYCWQQCYFLQDTWAKALFLPFCNHIMKEGSYLH